MAHLSWYQNDRWCFWYPDTTAAEFMRTQESIPWRPSMFYEGPEDPLRSCCSIVRETKNTRASCGTKSHRLQNSCVSNGIYNSVPGIGVHVCSNRCWTPVVKQLVQKPVPSSYIFGIAFSTLSEQHWTTVLALRNINIITGEGIAGNRENFLSLLLHHNLAEWKSNEVSTRAKIKELTIFLFFHFEVKESSHQPQSWKSWESYQVVFIRRY